MSELLARFAARAEDTQPSIIDARGVFSYADVVAGADAVATALGDRDADLGGERVAIFAPPGAAFVSAFYGALFAGASVVVLSPLHPAPETLYFCEDAGVQRVVVAAEHRELAAPLATAGRTLVALDPLLEAPRRHDRGSVTTVDALLERAGRAKPDDRALQLYTSGTTGKPKGAVLTHGNLSIQQRLVGEAWGFSERDVLLHALPLHHMHGLAIALLTALGAGATTQMTKFDAELVWNTMADATVFMGVPAMYHRLLLVFDAANGETQARWTSNARALRLATSGSAALPVGIAERWRALTGKIPLERFGMTEIGVGISNVLDGQRYPGCVGFPLPTVETRVVEGGKDAPDGEPGELLIRGPSVFAGYHGKDDATHGAFIEIDGQRWFRTGDTVARQRDLPGAPYKILGRTSVDILKSGGYKLSALEIEDVLREHPGVLEVAVVGLPDEAWGDRVVACVVRRTEGSTDVCDAETLRAFARTRLAPYKIPKDFVFTTDLPRNALGKVVKPEVVRELTQGRSRL